MRERLRNVELKPRAKGLACLAGAAGQRDGGGADPHSTNRAHHRTAALLRESEVGNEDVRLPACPEEGKGRASRPGASHRGALAPKDSFHHFASLGIVLDDEYRHVFESHRAALSKSRSVRDAARSRRESRGKVGAVWWNCPVVDLCLTFESFVGDARRENAVPAARCAVGAIHA